MRVTLTIAASIPNPEPNPINFRIRTLSGAAQCKPLFYNPHTSHLYTYQPCVAEEDYESVDSVITLAPMEQVLEYDILILDDQRVERLEVFSVLLEIIPGQDEVSGLALGQSTTDVFIKDNDCESCMDIADYACYSYAYI